MEMSIKLQILRYIHRFFNRILFSMFNILLRTFFLEKKQTSSTAKLIYSFLLVGIVLFSISLLGLNSINKNAWEYIYTFFIFGILGLLISIMDSLIMRFISMHK